jgi:hypothetical protein
VGAVAASRTQSTPGNLRLSSFWAPQTAFIGATVCERYITTAVMTWFWLPDKDFVVKSFNALLSHWDKCLNKGGDYTQKYVMTSACTQAAVFLW